MILSDLKQRNHIQGTTIVSPYWSDYKQQPLSPFDEYEQLRPNLLLCYGDSWTWGQKLGSADWAKNQDDDFRKQHVFGRLLSDRLDADFANSAYPGISNFWIIDRLQILIDHDIHRLGRTYGKIWIVVVLTEPAREFYEKKFLEDFASIYDPATDNGFSGSKLLGQLEKLTLESLLKIDDQLPDNCHMIVGRNFTHMQFVWKELDVLEKTWADVLLHSQGLKCSGNVLLMHFGIDAFIKWVNDHHKDDIEFKKWVIENIVEPGKKFADLLDDSIYNNKGNSNHPNAQGHAIWADYLYKHIQKINL